MSMTAATDSLWPSLPRISMVINAYVPEMTSPLSTLGGD